MKLKKFFFVFKCSGRARRGVECGRRAQGQDTSGQERLPDDGMNEAAEARIEGSRCVCCSVIKFKRAVFATARVDLELRMFSCECRCKYKCKCKDKAKWKYTYKCK